MKHPVAVAILSGFALAIAAERLKGNRVFKEKLEDFREDGEKIQSILDSNKVNLQKYGDS